MHVMMCFNMDIDLDPRPTAHRHRMSQYRQEVDLPGVKPCVDIYLVVQVDSPTHRRAVDLSTWSIAL